MRSIFAWRLWAAALLAGCAVAPASAQWKPTQDVQFVVPFGVGGGADLMARIIVKVMTEEKLVSVPINVVNKAGGGTSVGIAYVANTHAGDPHTLVLINPQSQITPIRIPDSRGWRDLAPVANVMLDDYLLITYGDSPYKSAGDLVARARAKPPKAISVGSSGPADDMAIAVFEAATGLHFKIVRFDGGGRVQTMLLGKHVDIGVGNPLEYMGQIKAGGIRVLGVYRQTRFPLMNNVPTMKEQGIETVPFQMWRGVAMPKGAPAEAMRFWQDVMRKVTASKTFKDYIASNMATEHVLIGADFQNFLVQQDALYRDMLSRLQSGK
jgi:tripartite-type tricarboxylate transporter receptor subunit TctC